MQVGEAFVAVRPDTSKFGPELQRGVETSGRQAASGLSQALTAGIAVAGFSRLISSASDLQQAMGGTEAVFGSASDAIDEFAANSADAVGLSEASYRQLASFAGNQLQGLGLDATEAAEQTNNLITMGADLAATFGGTTQQAVEALSATFRGEFDPVERYVAGLRASTVAAEAVRLGLAESTGEVDSYGRAQATLSLLTQGSADAQGQFAREADTAAGASARAAAEAENSAAAVGTNFLPVYQQGVAAVGAFAAVFGKLPAPLQSAAVLLGAFAAFKGPVSGAFSAISAAAQGMAGRFRAAGGGIAGFSSLITPGALGVGAAVVGIGLITSELAKNAERAEEARRTVSELGEAFASAGTAGVAETLFTQLSEDAPEVIDSLDAAGVSLRDFAEGAAGNLDTSEMERLSAVIAGLPTDQALELTGRLAALPSAIEDVAQGESTLEQTTPGATATIEDQASALSEVTDAADAARDSLDALFGAQQGADQAAIALQDAIDGLTESVFQNGRGFDLSTEAGRSNAAAAIDYGSAIRENTISLLQNGASAEVARASERNHIAALRDALLASGLSREETERLIDTYARVPNEVKTDLDANPAPAIAGTKQAVGYVSGNWAGRVFTATLGLNAGAAVGAIGALQDTAANAGFHIIESAGGSGGGRSGTAPAPVVAPTAPTVHVTVNGSMVGDVDRFADEIAYRAAEKLSRNGAI